LTDLCAFGRARFVAVGAGKAATADQFDGMELREWAEHREVADVQAMNIGIMPLPDEPWARGKCGYKLIQYMACGLPTVASPVGVNTAIVAEGTTGFLATSGKEWRRKLELLRDQPEICASFGIAGRERVVEDYSLETWAPRVLDLFGSVVSRTV
jgi:glycosyltransferase involved in cell wall biosynthesis